MSVYDIGSIFGFGRLISAIRGVCFIQLQIWPNVQQ